MVNAEILSMSKATGFTFNDLTAMTMNEYYSLMVANKELINDSKGKDN